MDHFLLHWFGRKGLFAFGLSLFCCSAIFAGGPLDAFRFQDRLPPGDCVAGNSATGETLTFCILVDREGNGVLPAVFVTDAQGRRHEIWRDYDRGFHPWKIEVTEIDGDPQPEIALGVYKKTRHDRTMRRRLFIYDWTGAGLFAKWLGSWTTQDLQDFAFLPRSSEAVAASLATREGDGSSRVRRYEWNGFGFTESNQALDESLAIQLFGRVGKK